MAEVKTAKQIKNRMQAFLSKKHTEQNTPGWHFFWQITDLSKVTNYWEAEQYRNTRWLKIDK